jgi:Fe-S-cluster containining protein
MKRLVVLPWRCQRSGDCCRAVPVVTMSRGERVVLERLADRATRPLEWVGHHDPAFTQLVAAPCPFLQGNDCAVHAERPMNCRRFGCYRPDVAAEPYEDGPLPFGCANLADRIAQSKAVRADYAARQAEAQVWGWTHGWPTDSR